MLYLTCHLIIDTGCYLVTGSGIGISSRILKEEMEIENVATVKSY